MYTTKQIEYVNEVMTYLLFENNFQSLFERIEVYDDTYSQSKRIVIYFSNVLTRCDYNYLLNTLEKFENGLIIQYIHYKKKKRLTLRFIDNV
jgi:hypothetical protein